MYQQQKGSILYDFDEEKYMRMMREEYREEGLKEGREEGLREGFEEGREEERKQLAYRMFDRNRTLEEISDLTGQSMEYVYQLRKEYTQMAHENIRYKTEKKKE